MPKKIAVARRRTAATRAAVKKTLPPHLKNAVQDVLDGLRECCDDDEKLVLLCLTNEEHEKVEELLADEEVGGEVEWSMGYMRGIEDATRMKPKAILAAVPPSEEDDEDGDDEDGDEDEDDGSVEDDEADEDEEFVADKPRKRAGGQR